MIGSGSLAEDALQSKGMSDGSSVLKKCDEKESRRITEMAPYTSSE